jgi:hypothetical protein
MTCRISRFHILKIWKVHIFRHLFVCFQTSVYTLGEFHQNRKNRTVFEELSVSIVDLMDYSFSGRNLKSAYISRHLYVSFQTSVYTLGEFHKNMNNSTVFEELSVSIVNLTVSNIRSNINQFWKSIITVFKTKQTILWYSKGNVHDDKNPISVWKRQNNIIIS